MFNVNDLPKMEKKKDLLNCFSGITYGLEQINYLLGKIGQLLNSLPARLWLVFGDIFWEDS